MSVTTFVPFGTKRGRPRSEALALVRKLWEGQMSDRSIARFHRAMRLLAEAEVPPEVKKRLLARSTRANGTFNFSEYERGAEALAAVAFVERENAQ